jgi:multidrug efflux pump subunit AcrA (membrane-fusion protein)
MKRSIVYLALFSVFAVAGCKPKFDEAVPKSGPVTEAVFASGSIEPKDAYMLTSLSDGFILKSYVTENDLVHDGQLLFELDNSQQHTQVQIAQTNVSYAKISASEKSPQLEQINQQMLAAKTKSEIENATLVRYQRLFTTHSVSEQDVDNANVNASAAYAAYRSAFENYKATADKAQQDLANTKSQLQNVQAGNRYFKLVAIGPSKVYQIFKKQGDLVRKGDQVAQLGNPDSIVVNLDVDEGSISKIHAGQQVLVELNTEKNKTYEAYISKIYPHFNDKSQSYQVEARFVKEIAGLIAGTQLQANIITNKKESVLLIPHAYMISASKVLVKKGDKVDTVNITTGIVSDEWIEVTSGLTATDKIVKKK